jgi:hypothetical protein
MAQEHRISVSLSAEQRALVDMARGSIDIAVFMREGALIYAQNMAAFRERLIAPTKMLVDGIDDLTPEDHIRLADAADADAMELEEFDHHLDALMLELEARDRTGAGR